MSEFKVGDRVMLEGVILPIAPYDNGFAVRMRGDDTTWNAITREAMVCATRIEPERGIEAHTHIPACKGTNCGSTTGMNHSPECEAEPVAAITGVPVENKALDLSKPVRLISGSEELEFIQLATNGMIIIRWPSGSLDVLTTNEVENIPEPKRTASRELTATMEGEGLMVRPSGALNYIGEISYAKVTYTEGEGWSVEEVK